MNGDTGLGMKRKSQLCHKKWIPLCKVPTTEVYKYCYSALFCILFELNVTKDFYVQPNKDIHSYAIALIVKLHKFSLAIL